MVKDTDGFVYGGNLFGERIVQMQQTKTTKKSKKTERGELLRYFMMRLNPARKEEGFKPLTEARLGWIFKGIGDGDLYALQSKCDKSKNFSSTFWWELDPKKHAPRNIPA